MRRIALLVVIAAAILVVPASASAATFCVAPLTGCDTDEANLSAAIADAVVSPGLDTIKLPPGTFSGGLSDALSPITFVGSGPSTIITGTPGTAVATLGQSGSSISNVAIHVGTSIAGLSLAGGTSADHVTISNVTSTAFVSGVIPGFGSGAATFSHGSIDLPKTAAAFASTAVTAGGVGTAAPIDVTDSTVSAPVGFKGPVDVRRTSISAANGYATRLSPGAALTKALFEDTTFNIQEIPGSPASPSAIEASGVALFNLSTAVTVRHSTILGDGSSGSLGLVATGVPGAVPGTGTINVTNSIVHGFDKAISRLGQAGPPDAPANVSVDYSDIDLSNVTSSGPGAITDGGHNLNVDPKFANAAGGDYSLASGSPLIDVGDPAGLAPATTDFPAEAAIDEAGNPRVAGGRTDIGAFEFQPPPAQPSPPAPQQQVQGTRLPTVAVNAFGITNKVFAVGPGATATSAAVHKSKKPKRGTAFTYTLSRDASVTIAITQKAVGHKKGRSCVKGKGKKHCSLVVTLGTLTRASGKEGANQLVFTGRIGRRALKPGSYTATIVATDADGGRSQPRSVSFKVVKG